MVLQPVDSGSIPGYTVDAHGVHSVFFHHIDTDLYDERDVLLGVVGDTFCQSDSQHTRGWPTAAATATALLVGF